MSKQESNYITINEKDLISIDYLCIPSHYKDDLENIVIPYGLLKDRIEALAVKIFEDYKNKSLVCLCVLKDSYRFFADLTRKIQDRSRTNDNGHSVPIKIGFIRYNENIDLLQNNTDLNEVKDQNVLLVECCIEHGVKMKSILNTLEKCSPKNVKCCSLLVKRTDNSNKYIPDYVGFSIPNRLVVGYALDFNEYFRDLEVINTINHISKPCIFLNSVYYS